ncbi:MAG TPA: LSM domain-containing protein [Candidatus Lokiarchaeia archaeon]|nr:LSM domain-containing protein [Candidatus Lokiarchaeia archaeon]
MAQFRNQPPRRNQPYQQRDQTSYQQQRNRPIDALKASLDKKIQIRVKMNRLFEATLRGFDEHLNLIVDNCIQKYNVPDPENSTEEERKWKEVSEELGRIIIRGDNVIFIEFNFETPVAESVEPSE